MAEHNIVAVYDTPAHAEAAISDLQAANVPQGAISRHAKQGATGMATDPAPQPGFWASLFGGGSESSTVYDRSMESGSTVVTVRVPDEHVTQVSDILERHNPVDLDERAASYETTTTTTTTAGATPRPVAAATTKPVAAATTRPVATSGSDTISLAAEQLAVGKRAVRGGTTRIHTYVVETPVEEQVTLHNETVHVDRRPVTDSRPVGTADFGEKTIEMRETAEEAVVGKTARVVEEIGLRTEGSDRVETVRDTVRREEVEIEEIGSDTATGTGATNKSQTVPTQKR